MEKISSILPKSPRTQNVDNSKAQPARPGAPLFGRPPGKVTQRMVIKDDMPELEIAKPLDLSFADKFSVESSKPSPAGRDKVTLSDLNDDEPQLSTYTRKGDMANVRIAEDVGRKFAKIDLGPKLEAAHANLESIKENLENPSLEDSVSA